MIFEQVDVISGLGTEIAVVTETMCSDWSE
jgi:hypothetical protein